MANKEFPLSIIIRAVNKATAEMQRITKDVRKFSKTVTDAGKTLSTALTLPIVGLGAASLKAFKDFEQGMSNVSTLIDTSTESMADMSKQTLALGRIPVEMNDLTSALYDVRSAGVAAAKQFTVLEGSAKLGVAGLGTTKEATDLVTSSLNSFQLEGDDAAKVYDTIFKTVKSGKTTIGQLSQGFGGVAGTVAASGTKLDEYLASVAALTTTGLPAAEAHTQLKAVISGLTRETKQTRAVFKALGAKDLKDLIVKSGGLVPALERVSRKLGGSEAKILELTGSTEALNAVLGLTGAQNATYAATLDSMRTGANAVDEAFAKQAKTMSSQMTIAKNSLLSAGVAIGQVLAPAVQDIAKAVQGLATWIAGLDETTQKWIVGIALAAATIGPAIILVGQMVAGFAALKTAIVVITTVMRVLTATMLTNPIVLIVTGIAVAALLIYKYWDPIKRFFSALWAGITQYFNMFVAWLANVFFAYAPLGIVIANWEPIKAWFADLWDSVVAIFQSAWEVIEGIVGKISGAVDTVVGAVDAVGDTFSGIGSGIGSLFSDDDEETQAPAPRAAAALGAGRLDQLAAAGAVSSSAAVRVEFANAPRGMRAAADRSSTADIDLAVGYQLGGL